MNRTPVAPPGLLRAAGESDADQIREFVCGLSPRSQYFRFFAAVAPPSSGLLRALCGAGGTADILLVTDGLGTVIGHGMGADQGSACDIGLVVADRWQQHGIGTLLLAALVDRAAGRGIRTLVLDVQPANERMLGMIARRWPGAPRERTPDAIVIRPQLTAAATDQHVPVPSVVSLASVSLASVSLASRPYSGEHRAENRPAAQAPRSGGWPAQPGVHLGRPGHHRGRGQDHGWQVVPRSPRGRQAAGRAGGPDARLRTGLGSAGNGDL